MLEAELARIDEDDFDLIRDLAEIELPKAEEPVKEETVDKAQTLVFDKIEDAGSLEVDFSAPTEPATLSDLSDSLKAMAEETSTDNTIILK
jgi:hypothetical protein